MTLALASASCFVDRGGQDTQVETTQGSSSSASSSTSDTDSPTDATTGATTSAEPTSASSDATDTPTTSGPCEVGQLGCACDEGDPASCVEPLVCVDGECDVPPCGNGVLDEGEECDDGNAIDGDGCNADCTAVGRLLWTFTRDGDAHQDDRVTDLIIDSDGFIIAVGMITNAANNSDVWIARFDPGGGLLWSNTYAGPGEARDSGEGLTAAINGAVIVVGRVGEQDDADAVVLRFDPNTGALVDAPVLFAGPDGGRDVLHDVVTGDGGKTFAVGSSGLVGNEHPLLVFVSGQMLEPFVFDGEQPGSYTALTLQGNNLIVCGMTEVNGGSSSVVRTLLADSGLPLGAPATFTPAPGWLYAGTDCQTRSDDGSVLVVTGGSSAAEVDQHLLRYNYTLATGEFSPIDAPSTSDLAGYGLAYDETSGEVVTVGRSRVENGPAGAFVRKAAVDDFENDERWRHEYAGDGADGSGFDAVAIAPSRNVIVGGAIDNANTGLDIWISAYSP